MFRRSVTLALLAISVLPVTASAAARSVAPAAPAQPVAVPPDLQSLEQKLLGLQLTSERFSATVSVAEKPTVKGPVGPFKHIFGRASSVVTALLSSSGEVSFTPLQGSFQVTFLGITLSARLIGSTLYVDEPFIAKLDGGRSWVEERNKSLTQALSLQSSTPGGSSTGAPGQEAQRLIKLIADAQSIAELGAADVDGQAVTRFKLAVPLSSLLKPGHSRQQRAAARLQRKLFKPLLRVELFLAESGLPVRTNVNIGLRKHAGALIEQSDVTAINVPVLVQPPPADETITAAELHRLMRKRLKRIVAVRSHHRTAKKK